MTHERVALAARGTPTATGAGANPRSLAIRVQEVANLLGVTMTPGLLEIAIGGTMIRRQGTQVDEAVTTRGEAHILLVLTCESRRALLIGWCSNIAHAN